MRYNVAQQSRGVRQAVRVSRLAWSTAIGGEDLALAVQQHFAARSHANQDQDKVEDNDPLQRITHVIASDVHWGTATLEPLSDVIAALKCRNPHLAVTLLLQERQPHAVQALQAKIQDKVAAGLTKESSPRHGAALDDFSVQVRTVVHDMGDSVTIKLVEC